MYISANVVVKPYTKPSPVVPKVEHPLKVLRIPNKTESIDKAIDAIVTAPLTKAGAGVNVTYPV